MATASLRARRGSYDSAWVKHPTVLRLENGAYRMYYDGVAPDPKNPVHGISRILSAYSEDGLSWIKDDGIRVDVEEDWLGRVWVLSRTSFLKMGFTASISPPFFHLRSGATASMSRPPQMGSHSQFERNLSYTAIKLSARTQQG